MRKVVSYIMDKETGPANEAGGGGGILLVGEGRRGYHQRRKRERLWF